MSMQMVMFSVSINSTEHQQTIFFQMGQIQISRNEVSYLIYTHVEEEATEVPATTSEVPTVAVAEEALAPEEPIKEEAKPVCLFYFIFYSH